ncbi:uncharacterized protein I303_104780 [Kwoniella dejecticola CBS 10117]|uniref:Inositolphosphorylceramide synthase n=1 Tax=Kwoniella dejecticola CBS 10117 TaxID=1296121 RepID=A0A1A6A4C9_9TREE|nr:inositolphosphorylceramide synthase [Kwoniella dejecticola CBS 10117]OBR84916.1 inositolphosphorylceramide synthase [Kwoniella dejecticola CBS 10117]
MPSSLPRMLLAPILRLLRLSVPVSGSVPNSTTPSSFFTQFYLALIASLQRLDLSRDPRKTLHKLSQHRFTLSNILPLVFMSITSLYSLWIMQIPTFSILKLIIPSAYGLAVLLPITSQFVWPATPIFAWLLMFFCARFIPSGSRPTIHVALLPALESVLYGANISDLQTRYTNAVLDVIAWLPYGVLHFIVPFVVALFLWMFGPRGAVQYWGLAFGWMNLLGVFTQLVFPAAAPWYEIIHGLTPADYSMPGSPGGLLRIDRVFHSSGYTNTFGNAPLVFGAVPSLHSGCAVMEALFLSHFFPAYKPFYWAYVGVLWWATMYLSHHYLIDVTAGACLSVLVFYLTMPLGFKDVDQINWDRNEGSSGYEMISQGGPHRTNKDFNLDLDEEIRKLEENEGLPEDDDVAGGRDEESKIESGSSKANNGFPGKLNINTNVGQSAMVEAEGAGAGEAVKKPKIKKKRSVSWGETKVLGEQAGGGDISDQLGETTKESV